MNWKNIAILISSILILLMLIYIRFQEYKRTEKYQPNEVVDEEKKEIIPVWRLPSMLNIPSDWVYEILTNFDLQELNRFYTTNKDKKNEVDRFIKIYYNLDGGLGELNRIIKIVLPNDFVTSNLVTLKEYASESLFNQRLVNLFLQDRFGINNLNNFPNVAFQYTGDWNIRTPEENQLRRRAVDLILETLEKIYKSLGTRFVKLTERVTGEKVLLINYTNLLPNVYSYFDRGLNKVDIEKKSPFIVNLNPVGLLTWLRDPTDEKAMENWSKIGQILEDFREKVVEFGGLEQLGLETDRDFALFRINPYIKDNENFPFYNLYMGRGLLRIYKNEDAIYDAYKNAGLRK